MATARLPASIEQPLLALDRQVRDAVFTRGLSRLTLVATICLAAALATDGWLCLNGPVRGGLLAVWTGLFGLVAWLQVLRPMFRPLSLAELAAIVESHHPELKERLISLVEFRTAGTAPGASRLMRELMAKQTVRAVEQLDLSDSAPANRSPRMAFAAVVACFLLFAPFLGDSHGYGLLWARFFAPWGNFNWGSLELLIPDGDQVVAKGSDVPIRIEAHRRTPSATPLDQTVVWLHWTDTSGATDTRRLEWDADASCFAATLPHVFHGFDFHATTRGAQSRTHRIHVADRPSLTRLHLDISPPAYTGLPARTLDGAQGEVRATERSRIDMQFEFNEPVSAAELVWPVETDAAHAASNETPVKETRLPLKLTADKRSATVEATALASGSFAIQLKNSLGLANEDPSRTLAVDPDLPPAISLAGNEEPVAVKPDDRHFVKADIRDDYGLTTVELHLETSTGQQRTDTLPAAALSERRLKHEFPIDIADFALTPGQAVSYRLRAVDNRPVPQPQETWTKPRTLMVQSQVTPPPDPQVAEQQQQVDEQLANIREDLAEAKAALQKLHAQTEQESLKQKNTDKTEQLEQLNRQQAEIVERLQQLAAELAENRLTEKLAPQAANIADRDLAAARSKLDEAQQTPESRDQLAPISQSIDRLAAADKQLKTLERQLNELQRLEQDLAELDRIANKADRLAEQLEQFDQQQRDAANQQANADTKPTDTPPNDANPGESKEGEAPAEPMPNDVAANAERQQQLQTDGQKLAQELNELLKKHPELLDAARQDQRQKLEQLAEQARELAKPQQQLADAFQQEAANAPASAEKPLNQENGAPKQSAEGESNPEPRDDADNSKAGTAKSDTPPVDSSPASEPKSGAEQSDSKPADAGAQAVRQQQRLAQQATRQALELAREQGAESEATQAATEFAKQATVAAQQAQTGQLGQAAEQAQAAAQAAERAARELAPEGQPSNPQSEQANQLAQQQHQLAEQLEQLASSTEAQRGAQQQGQQQLAQATQALAKRLEQATETLASSPLDEQHASDAAARAQEAAAKAGQSMKRAAAAMQADNASGAADQAAQAADQLQQAARAAQEGQPSEASDSPVPEDVAAQVADAARQLQQAQQLLANPPSDTKPDGSQPGGSPPDAPNSPPSPGTEPASSEGTPSGQPGENRPSPPGQPNSNAKPATKPGSGSGGDGGNDSTEQGTPAGARTQSQLAQTAEQFRQAAGAMRRALHGEGEATASNEQGQPNGKSKPSRATQGQPNVAPDPNGEPGETLGLGGGGIENADLGQLDSELKKQAQRNWGKLPGSLRTEILQGASKKPHPEYARQIKSYFEEIAKPAAKDGGK